MFSAVWIASRMTVIDEDRRVVGRVEVPPEPVVGQARHVADDAGVDGRDGDQERHPVEPAHEPAEGRPDRELAVLVERAGDRVVACQLTEDERDEKHSCDGHPGEPEVRRPSRAHAEHEERVDPHHRGEVRERHREVREEAEYAVQLRLVAEALEPSILARRGDRDGRACLCISDLRVGGNVGAPSLRLRRCQMQRAARATPPALRAALRRPPPGGRRWCAPSPRNRSAS